jgi:nucleotide-binding universal stress UspA family protein
MPNQANTSRCQSQWRLQPRAKLPLHIVRRSLIFWEVVLSIGGEFSTLLHPTDFEPDSELAFVHSVRLALRARQTLTLFTIAVGGEAPHGAPIKRVVDLLMRWSDLPPRSTVEALERDLGFRVVSARVPESNPRAGIVDYVENHPCELAVIATRDHRRLSHWLERSVAERVLRLATTMVLILRQRSRAFVKPNTGELALKRVLVPIDGVFDPTPALARLEAWLDKLQAAPEIRLFHVGAEPPTIQPNPDGRAYEMTLREGPTAPTILDFAASWSADLIAVPTAPRHGVIAALRGSVSSAILDDARWPVLSLPAH